MLEVRHRGGSDGLCRPVSQAWTRDYPAEFQITKDGTPLLQNLSKLTGGKSGVKPEEILRPALHPAAIRRDLAPWLLAAALAFLPIDICSAEENGRRFAKIPCRLFRRPISLTR
jgi:hypothetical protein